MAEPIPSASNKPSAAAAAADDDETAQNLPKNAEDRKAAAALNSLNANTMSQEGGETAATKQPSAADQEALGKAMSRLEIASGLQKNKKTTSAVDSSKKTATEAAKKTTATEEPKKKVKVASEDVQFLVEELDLSKNKATELLRGNEGDVGRAVGAFLRPVRAGA